MSPTQHVPEFIEGLESPEDLAIIPGTRWLITSGFDPNARPCFVHLDTREVVRAYPDRCDVELDAATYGEIEPLTDTWFQGLDLRVAEDGRILVYYVNHPCPTADGGVSGRESVEVFEIRTDEDVPRMLWIGAIPVPSWVFGNEVVALRDGGVALTNFCSGAAEGFPMVLGGGPTGNVLEWHNRQDGWRNIQGTDANGVNGLAVSAQEDWWFIACWGTKEVLKIPRGSEQPTRQSLDTGLLNDNITWTLDRRHLLVTGQDADPPTLLKQWLAGENVNFPLKIFRIDPETMESETIVDYRGDEIGATTALQVSENEIWVGQARGTCIAVFTLG